MAEQLNMIGLSFKSTGVHLFEAVRPETPDEFPSIGARGCFLSHLGVLRDASNRRLDRILILEDDLNFVPEFSVRIGAVVAALERKDWSVFYGGYTLSTDLERKSTEELIHADPSLGVQTTHFIGLRGQAISEAVSYLERMLTRPSGDPGGGPMHVDGAYSWYRRAFPERLTLLATPQLGYQRSSRSDIYTLRWFDRTPGVLHAVAAIRKLRNLGHR
jgi:GR25 family glycosyltransferase involved in LPS biosynthesis